MEMIKILQEIKSQMIDDVMSGEFDNVAIFANAQAARINGLIDKLHAEIGGEE